MLEWELEVITLLTMTIIVFSFFVGFIIGSMGGKK